MNYFQFSIFNFQPLTAIIPKMCNARRSSTPAKIALAQHLTQIGAKMYGAYWCHHCHKQKQMLGKQAIVQIDYDRLYRVFA